MPEAHATSADVGSEAGAAAASVYDIASLEVRARVVADGVLAGMHRSRRLGPSNEFAEYKTYAPGDDLRRLDWRAFARMDKYLVRMAEEDRNIEVALVVDTSRSMSYAGGARGTFGVSKLETAKTLAAALASIAVRTADAPSLALFSEVFTTELPARARMSQLTSMMIALQDVRAEGRTAFANVLTAAAERMKKRAFVVVLSDFIDMEPNDLRALGVLRRRGSDVLLLQTLHPDELELPFDGIIRFEDLEGDRMVQVDAPLVRASYKEELRQFLAGITDTAGALDVRHALVPTNVSPVEALFGALTLPGSAR